MNRFKCILIKSKKDGSVFNIREKDWDKHQWDFIKVEKEEPIVKEKVEKPKTKRTKKSSKKD